MSHLAISSACFNGADLETRLELLHAQRHDTVALVDAAGRARTVDRREVTVASTTLDARAFSN